MRYLVLSDIHSSIEALDACIQRAKRAGYDEVLCCGDIVGYGPDPVEVMDRLDQIGAVSIRGNHDRVASGLDEPANFNSYAKQAVYWTRAQLPETHRAQLAALPVGPREVGHAQLVHGSLTHEDDYVVTEEEAELNLRLSERQITFFGHSHEAVVFAGVRDRLSIWTPRYDANGLATCPPIKAKLLVNPGSVGQPRDGDWRASFVIWDSDAESFEFYRTEYDVSATQTKMHRAGLPGFLAQRLSHGR